MHKLSVIIVNYKVRDLLLRCLECVQRASAGIDAEIFVVDNASGDGSKEAVEERFPDVRFIQSEENLGFAKANNLAIRESDSEYLLLLNPDLFVADDTLVKVLDFAANAEKFGALGVRMVDGDSNFLPESKRNKPTLWNSFCKIVGLTRLFPNSKLFASYYNVGLKDSEAGRTDVLAGAFMLLNYKELGVHAQLCEDYFMFGEDVDLSVSILEQGFYNYYCPETVTHLKGKSTNHHSKTYYEAFYGSMSIYYRRHHKSRVLSSIVAFVVKIIIYLKLVR